MRKTETVTITSEGRDKGKVFLITEKPVMQAERWGYRAMLALAHSGANMPEGSAAGGMASWAFAGLKSLERLQFDEAQPLLDEMIPCIQVIPDPKNPMIVRPVMYQGVEGDDIEELSTIFLLRERIFRMHTDFFFKGS